MFGDNEEDQLDLYEYLFRDVDPLRDSGARQERLSRRNRRAFNAFIGKGCRAVEGLSKPAYYRDVTAWGVKHCLQEKEWQVLAVFGYAREKPVYRDIETDVDKTESCLISGQMVVEKDGTRLVVTADLSAMSGNYLQIEGQEATGETVTRLIKSIEGYVADHNFYRGKVVVLAGGKVRFAKYGCRCWESVILDQGTKAMIRRNTVGFLRNHERWARYGIPTKRGIILAGAPGTGKTAICKAVISEAAGLTCLLADSTEMVHAGYFGELYEVAFDLAPCIVFIEDIDLIGLDRIRDGYRPTPHLLALLAEMDGISETDRIVTVATTNNVETLDEALTRRPARFDRIVTISAPSAGMRAAQIEMLSAKIHLSPQVKDYLCRTTEGLSPAQIQEVMFGLAINRDGEGQEGDGGDFTTADVDRSIAELKHKTGRPIGFKAAD